MPSLAPEQPVAPAIAPEVAPVFADADGRAGRMMQLLRRLIFQTAAETPGVGELAETLKWGQPSYAPKKPRIGSSVRLGARDDGAVAVYFICHTHLVDRFRERYPDHFNFEGNRALVFEEGAPLPEDELKHCIAMALTYHLGRG
jgi:hypothetical protein